MRYYTPTPTRRTGVPFDPFSNLFSGFGASESGPRYQPGPRYNVEQLDDDHFRIAVAVPGFAEADLDVTQREDEILVTGTVAADNDDEANVSYLHRGIGGRPFERRFSLAEGVRATGANLENGVLRIDLLREVPEEQKPRAIAISAPSKRKRKAA
ncbi:MAG: Hsp20 family protein [Alphaproteobacteria bacterium]|jgi:molecular chaperone IbpA|nr:Hsp20 family protein [Alphaproteobacteria bacterium]MBT4711770.1 Hsp20 family protein [Alphaproteobacteria bacterium]MBT5859911.1 Hsp20 family protein [Alphaproteobacteria bacterium]